MAVQQALFLQHAIKKEMSRLPMDDASTAISLRGWQGQRRSLLLLAGWALARQNPAGCAVDLRECNLTPDEAERLAEVLRCCPKLVAVDIRQNEGIGARRDFLIASNRH